MNDATAGHGARLAGPDVVRALALIGVAVMNYHGYLIHAGAERQRDGWPGFFDPWEGPLATRFAATFVLTAGVGVTLLTRSATTPDAIRRRRITLVRRGLFLFVGGWLIDLTWAGTILPYYGAFFVVAAALFTARDAVVVGVGVAAAVAGAAIAAYRRDRSIDGEALAWLDDPGRWSVVGLARDTFVDGTHPLLPWLLFLCVGIVLGRRLRDPGWRTPTLVLGLGLFVAGTLVARWGGDGPLAAFVTSDDPFDRGLPYSASALGTALVAFAVVSWAGERWIRFPVVDALRHAGPMTLTLYLAHIVVYKVFVEVVDVVEPGTVVTALTFAAAFWIVAVVIGAWYHRRFGIGPVEWVYRTVGG